MKVCTKCKTEKDFSLFGKDKWKKSGYSSQCLICIKEAAQVRRDNNPTRAREVTKNYRVRNSDKEKARYTKYNKENPEVRAHHSAKRRSDTLNATPSWLTKEQHDDIKAMYRLAKKFEKLCDVRYHVDHIVPLAGNDVCGLHVPWNLQLLPAKINMTKGNRYNGETF